VTITKKKLDTTQNIII